MTATVQDIENLQSAEMNGNCGHCVYWQTCTGKSLCIPGFTREAIAAYATPAY